MEKNTTGKKRKKEGKTERREKTCSGIAQGAVLNYFIRKTASSYFLPPQFTFPLFH